MGVITVLIMLQSSYAFLIGMVKGLGYQSRATLIAPICHFGIGLPLAAFMGH